MAQYLRWTPAQLEDYLKKKNGGEVPTDHPLMREAKKSNVLQDLMGKASSINSWDHLSTNGRPCEVAKTVIESKSTKNLTKKYKKEAHQDVIHDELKDLTVDEGDKNTKPGLDQRARSIESLKSATFIGIHEPGKFLELHFKGVNLLSVNRLYALTHFQRIRYRKMWHELIERAIQGVLGEASGRTAFPHYVVRAHRVSRRLSDTDAKSGYLKYPIDGLRYSGVLLDDTEAQFKDFFCTQSKGSPALFIRIDAVDVDYVPVGLRDPWTQALVKEIEVENMIKAIQKKAPRRKVDS